MKRNPCLAEVLRALDSAGVAPIVWRGGKHVRVRWRNRQGEWRSYTVPLSPSDWRAVRNTRADLRRILRRDNHVGAGS